MKWKYLTHCALFLAACYLSTNAFAQWVWLDAQGAKQYSDMPPPMSVPQNRILKQPHQAENFSSDKDADKPSAASANSAAKAPPTLAEKEADFNKRRTEQAAKDKKAAEEAQRAQAKADNCARAKSYEAGLQGGARIQTTDPTTGERSYLSDDNRAKEETRTQGIIDSCNQ